MKNHFSADKQAYTDKRKSDTLQYSKKRPIPLYI